MCFVSLRIRHADMHTDTSLSLVSMNYTHIHIHTHARLTDVAEWLNGGFSVAGPVW